MNENDNKNEYSSALELVNQKHGMKKWLVYWQTNGTYI